MVALTGASVVLLSGCNERPTGVAKQASLDLPADFRGFGPATNGGRLSNIVREFGDPTYSGIRDGKNELHFAIDPSAQVPRGLVGVALFEKNGVVFNVRPITGDSPPFNKAERAAAKNIMPRDLVLKVGESVVTIRPKGAAPSQMNEESETPRMLRAIVDLTDEDARAIEMLTATNVGNTVRLYLEQDYVSEFLIREEIRTNTFEIRFEHPGIPFQRLYKVRPPEAASSPTIK
jgi:hypothetical protein